jgi:uncharacterized LabA/DUF88 family protein
MHKVIGFADGENLVFRYQDMIKDGEITEAGVIHVPDLLVWHPLITQQNLCDIGRITYYQTAAGDELKIDELSQRIAQTQYTYEVSNDTNGPNGIGTLRPKIFKKPARSTKTKSVDINITVDMLRQAYGNHFDVLFLLSGDGDYLPLVEEAIRRGKQIWIAAFSKGLNKDMRYAADEFIDLDALFFKKVQ